MRSGKDFRKPRVMVKPGQCGGNNVFLSAADQVDPGWNTSGTNFGAKDSLKTKDEKTVGLENECSWNGA